MNHWTDEQLEEILLTGRDDPAHLASCPACRRRMEEKRALQDRLRSAFETVRPSADLRERIRRQIAASDTDRGRTFTIGRAGYRGIAVAAAVVLVGVGLVIRFAAPSLETEVQAQLVQYHEANLDRRSLVLESDDPVRLTAHLQSRLGYAPLVPRAVEGATLGGCGIRVVCRKPAGSYLLRTPDGMVSIIAIHEHPRALGLEERADCQRCQNCQCWVKSLPGVNLAAVRRGEFSYYAVGDAPQETLAAILMAAYPMEAK